MQPSAHAPPFHGRARAPSDALDANEDPRVGQYGSTWLVSSSLALLGGLAAPRGARRWLPKLLP
jgi:hypothetical protein